jgi:hypothetical protein
MFCCIEMSVAMKEAVLKIEKQAPCVHFSTLFADHLYSARLSAQKVYTLNNTQPAGEQRIVSSGCQTNCELQNSGAHHFRASATLQLFSQLSAAQPAIKTRSECTFCRQSRAQTRENRSQSICENGNHPVDCYG